MKNNPAPQKANERPKFAAFAVSTLKAACVIFTVLAALILIFNLIYSSVNGESGKYFNTTLFLFSILPFSFVIAVAHTLLSVRSLGIYRWIAHVLLCNGGVFFIILLPYKKRSGAPTSAVIFAMLLFVIVYAVATVVRAILIDRANRRKSDKSEYVGMFSKK